MVEGKAFVACPASARAVEAWVQKDDHFYCDIYGDTLTSALEDLQSLSWTLVQCNQCHAASLDASLKEETLLGAHQKLRGLELFAGAKSTMLNAQLDLTVITGAGGLSTGLELSGFVETRWAVEFSPSAAKTFQ